MNPEKNSKGVFTETDKVLKNPNLSKQKNQRDTAIQIDREITHSKKNATVAEDSDSEQKKELSMTIHMGLTISKERDPQTK